MMEIAGVTIYSRKGYGYIYSSNHYTVIIQHHGVAQDEYSYGQVAGM